MRNKRRLALGVSLLALAFLIGWWMGAGRRSLPEAVALDDVSLFSPIGPVVDPATVPSGRNRLTAPTGVDASRNLPAPGLALTATYAHLAAKAADGDVGAAMRLAQDLERCLRRRETASVLAIMARYPEASPKCESVKSCSALNAIYDEFDSDLEQLKTSEALCEQVPREWLDVRGRWLQRAAELGDTEARACYALVGIEIAPHPGHDAWGS